MDGVTSELRSMQIAKVNGAKVVNAADEVTKLACG
jgi:hypothetical protein